MSVTSRGLDDPAPGGRVSAPPWKPTACILCECNCGIEVKLEGRRLARIRGDKQHPSSRGYVCEKPGRLDHYQNAPDRLLSPLRRRADGTFEEISWELAIREVAARFSALRDQHGGDSILYYGGGGQGNHLPGTYAVSTRGALGSRYRSSALAQEKTGEFWVKDRMLGTLTRADFEHCQVGLFLGKNPWFSHGIPRARVTLKELSRDPERRLIVVDPRRTKTASLADIHLQLKPGTDAWLMGALVAVLLEEGLTDAAFLEQHAEGLEAVQAVLGQVDVAAWCAHAGLAEEQVRETARILGRAESVATFEDLGVQMNRHSTLVSYLNSLVFLLTGNLGKPGTAYSPTSLVPIGSGRHKRDTPVTGARIIGGLMPCNSLVDEILTDHPKRFRGMLVEASNPAHSLADSARFREAMEALDTLVVIDVALTETAKLADYVLPASTQYEKAEATYFNFEFPDNVFHLRPALMAPPEGPLPEAEMHARLCEELGVLDVELVAELSAAAELGLSAYIGLFLARVAFEPRHQRVAGVLLYRTLGPVLPEGKAEAAVLLGPCLQAAMKSPEPLARAGFEGPPAEAGRALFEAILQAEHGLVFAVDLWGEVLDRVRRPGGRIQLDLPDLLEELAGLSAGPAQGDPDFPLVLAAGERRSFTANTILRDPSWRKVDTQGALRISPQDAQALGLSTGDRARLATRRGSAEVLVEVSDTMRSGHISLPNGMGIGAGVSPNELTDNANQDRFVGTPLHKHVPARLSRLP